MRIETGTTNERMARCGIMALALCVFAGWFVVDGWYRYQRKALETFQMDLGLKELPQPHPKLAFTHPERHRDKFNKAVKKGMLKINVLTEYGEPLSIKKDLATNTDFWHYVGQFCRLAFEVEPTADPNVGKVIAVTLEPAPADYRYESIQIQRIFAVTCGVLGLLGLIWLVKVWRTRVVVDDNGLVYDRTTVPWEAMTELDSGQYHAKGWVDLLYTSDRGDRRLRLDTYKVDAFDDVIDAICQRKGFANPIPIDDYGDETPADTDDG